MPGLLSLAALHDASDDAADRALPRGRRRSCRSSVSTCSRPSAAAVLPYAFWRRFAEIENVVAIKIAPFNRYQTLDVIRAVAESGRDVALYTGNDDNIVMDLLTPFPSRRRRAGPPVRIVGGLLGHWAVWTRRAVELWQECQPRRGGCVGGPATSDPTRRRSHRRERRVLRRRERVRRLHRRPPRGAAAPGVARRASGAWTPMRR